MNTNEHQHVQVGLGPAVMSCTGDKIVLVMEKEKLDKRIRQMLRFGGHYYWLPTFFVAPSFFELSRDILIDKTVD